MCCVCSHVVIAGLSVRLSRNLYVDAVVAVTVMCILLFVCVLRERG